MNEAVPKDAKTPVPIVVRFWAWALLLRPLKHVLPLKLLVRLVRSRRQSAERLTARETAIVDYMSSRLRFPRRAPANCLERSLAAYRLLGEAGSRPELMVGVRRLPAGQRRNGATRPVDGHVWIVLDRQPAAETAAFIDTFTPVLRVDADGRIDAGSRPAS